MFLCCFVHVLGAAAFWRVLQIQNPRDKLIVALDATSIALICGGCREVYGSQRFRSCSTLGSGFRGIWG